MLEETLGQVISMQSQLAMKMETVYFAQSFARASSTQFLLMPAIFVR